jgi:hypothetical protein
MFPVMLLVYPKVPQQQIPQYETGTSKDTVLFSLTGF